MRERHDHQGVVGVGHRGGDDGDGELYMNEYQCGLNLKFSARGTSLSLPAPTYSSPRRALPWTGSPSSSSPSASSYSPLTSSFAALSFVRTKR